MVRSSCDILYMYIHMYVRMYVYEGMYISMRVYENVCTYACKYVMYVCTYILLCMLNMTQIMDLDVCSVCPASNLSQDIGHLDRNVLSSSVPSGKCLDSNFYFPMAHFVTSFQIQFSLIILKFKIYRPSHENYC